MLVLGAAIFVQRQNNRESRGVPRSPGIHIIAPPKICETLRPHLQRKHTSADSEKGGWVSHIIIAKTIL